jgi:glycogen operon protein
MILMGDEWGRTQGGNNNAYCQDNEMNWLDWEEHDDAFAEFVARLTALRRTRALLRVQKFRHGRPIGQLRIPDVVWLRPDGNEMAPEDWQNGMGGRVGLMLNGVGQRSLVLLFNPRPEEIEFTMPSLPDSTRWRWLLDTGDGVFEPEWEPIDPGSPVVAGGRAICVLESVEVLE